MQDQDGQNNNIDKELYLEVKIYVYCWKANKRHFSVNQLCIKQPASYKSVRGKYYTSRNEPSVHADVWTGFGV